MPSSPTRLPVRFAISALVAFLAVGVSLSVLVSRHLRDSEEAAAASHGRFVVTTLLSYALTPSDLTAPISATRGSELTVFLQERSLGSDFSVVRVNIVNPDGTVIVSDDPELVGKKILATESLAAAYRGQQTSGVADLGGSGSLGAEHLAEKIYATYVPLYLTHDQTSGRPDAVVQIYSDYSGIQSQVDRLFGPFILVLIGGLSILYVTLLPLTRRVSRTLVDQAERLRRLLDKERATVVELREASRAKDEFAAVASHELRTPLTSIIGSLATLRLPQIGDDPEARGEFTTAASLQAKRLLGLLDNLFTAADIGRDRFTPTFTTFSLAEVIDMVLQGLGAASDRVHLDIPDDLPALRSDREAIGRITANLVDNALKFSSDDATCDVGVRRDGEWISLWVTDAGVGIPQEELGRIFDRYYQVDSSSTRPYGGMGLGLSLVKDLAAALGGTIDVSSRIGEGSTFRVRFPIEHPSIRPMLAVAGDR